MAAIFFLAGLVKGGVAFGVPLVTVPLLAQIVPVPTAAALSVVPIVVSNVVQVVQTRQAADVMRRLWPLFLALPVTLAVSVRLIATLDAAVLYLLIGSLVLVFVLLQVTGRMPPIPAKAQGPVLALSGVVAGVLGGATSFFAFPSLQVFLALGLPPLEFVFATSAMFAVGSIVLGAGFAALGVLEGGELAVSLAALVPLLLGLQVGQALARRLSVAMFRLLVLLVLALMGASMMARGVGL
jgi:uncharacterized membrane protein YfcA